MNLRRTKEFLKKSKNFFKKNIKWILLAICLVLSILLFKQCDNTAKYKKETFRLENNILAMNDTLKNYKDKNGLNTATMRALQLRMNELADSLKLEKGKEPITILQYVAGMHDTIWASVKVVHDTMYIEEIWSDSGILTISDTTVFGKSSRYLNVSIPYGVNCETGKLQTEGDAIIDLNQDVWIDSYTYKDKKGYTWMDLKSDYPIYFHNGTAISISNPKDEYKNRKQFGLGLGLQVGYGISFPDESVKMSPYIGLGISLNWNPRFLQF